MALTQHHNGQCGRCGAAVQQDFDTCARCGSRWLEVDAGPNWRKIATYSIAVPVVAWLLTTLLNWPDAARWIVVVVVMPPTVVFALVYGRDKMGL